MNQKTLTIPGIPIAKKRPRFARVGKFVKTYNPQETEEGRVLWEIKQRWDIPPIETGIQIQVIFYMPIPKSFPKKLAPELVHHIKRPDLDNLLKFLKDVCNQTVWKDDSLVYKVRAEKHYGIDPQTFLIVEW